MHTWWLLAGACLIAIVGGIDDASTCDRSGSCSARSRPAIVAVEAGVVVTDVTVPFVGALQFPNAGGVLTVIWLVGLMNVVNFSDGVDGLAAGLCAIDGIAFAVIAFDLDVAPAGVLAALTAGAALGFLFHNFHPASVFMGDSGANLLGYLLGVAAVIGSLKTNAVVALVVPLFILAVPFLDTGFVVAKRLKYRRKPWRPTPTTSTTGWRGSASASARPSLYLYAWSLMLAGAAVSLRFVPYHHDHPDHFSLGWSLVMVVITLIAVAVEHLPDLRARDPQVPKPSLAGDAADRPGHERARDRRARPRGRRDRRVRTGGVVTTLAKRADRTS